MLVKVNDIIKQDMHAHIRFNDKCNYIYILLTSNKNSQGQKNIFKTT